MNNEKIAFSEKLSESWQTATIRLSLICVRRLHHFPVVSGKSFYCRLYLNADINIAVPLNVSAFHQALQPSSRKTEGDVLVSSAEKKATADRQSAGCVSLLPFQPEMHRMFQRKGTFNPTGDIQDIAPKGQRGDHSRTCLTIFRKTEDYPAGQSLRKGGRQEGKLSNNRSEIFFSLTHRISYVGLLFVSPRGCASLLGEELVTSISSSSISIHLQNTRGGIDKAAKKVFLQ